MHKKALHISGDEILKSLHAGAYSEETIAKRESEARETFARDGVKITRALEKRIQDAAKQSHHNLGMRAIGHLSTRAYSPQKITIKEKQARAAFARAGTIITTDLEGTIQAAINQAHWNFGMEWISGFEDRYRNGRYYNDPSYFDYINSAKQRTYEAFTRSGMAAPLEIRERFKALKRHGMYAAGMQLIGQLKKGRSTSESEIERMRRKASRLLTRTMVSEAKASPNGAISTSQTNMQLVAAALTAHTNFVSTGKAPTPVRKTLRGPRLTSSSQPR